MLAEYRKMDNNLIDFKKEEYRRKSDFHDIIPILWRCRLCPSEQIEKYH